MSSANEVMPAITATVRPASPHPSLEFVRIESKKNTVLQSHGRRPWYVYPSKIPLEMRLDCITRYGEDGVPFSDAFVVGIAGEQITHYSSVMQPDISQGGSASGKVTYIMVHLN
jgi:hypothetical protein